MEVIVQINYNWAFTEANGQEFQSYVLGQEGVSGIISVGSIHDKIYRIEFENGDSTMIYNPNQIFMKSLSKETK